MTDSGKIVDKSDLVVNPNFFIPPHVVDIRYLTEQDVLTEEETVDSITPESDAEAPDYVIEEGESVIAPVVGDQLGAEELPIPDWMTIISQTVKMAPDGTSSVDVVIEVQDLPGILQLDVKVTKL